MLWISVKLTAKQNEGAKRILRRRDTDHGLGPGSAFLFQEVVRGFFCFSPNVDPIFIFSANFPNNRTWKSILRALEHPTYTPSSLQAILTSRIDKLKKCVDAFSLVRRECSLSEDSITVDGVKFDVTPQQKDLVDKLSKATQADPTEALRIVLQQNRVGVIELDGLVKAYMEERTALLQVVKKVFEMDAKPTANSKTGAIAKEIAKKLKNETNFLSSLVQGVKKRTGQELPHPATTDEAVALLWSRQV